MPHLLTCIYHCRPQAFYGFTHLQDFVEGLTTGSLPWNSAMHVWSVSLKCSLRSEMNYVGSSFLGTSYRKLTHMTSKYMLSFIFIVFHINIG
jgi:hypothetical protein